MKRYTIALLLGAFLVVSLAWSGGLRPLEVKGAATNASPQMPDQWNSTTPFNNPRVSHQSVLFDNKVYVLGGYYFDFDVGLILYNDVQYASLKNNGSIQNGWHYTTPFQTPRLGHSAVEHNGYLYVVAGGDGFGYLSDVQYAKLNSDGTVASSGWHTSPNSINVPRSNHVSLVHQVDGKTYLYVIGGVGDVNGNTVHFNTVEYARINNDGSVGKWKVSPDTFIKGRSALGCVIVNGYLYVIGGWGDDFVADIFSDVQYAPFNNNGSVGPWTTSQYSIQTGRYGHTAVLYPNPSTILILGGNAGGGQYLNDLQYTTTNGGETAAWTQLPAEFNFPTPRWGHTSISYRDRVYVIGGSRIGGFLNDVQYRRLDLGQ